MIKATLNTDGTVTLTMDRDTAVDLRLWLVLRERYRDMPHANNAAEQVWEALHDVTSRGIVESNRQE